MNINLSITSVERILQDPPAKAHMQEQRTIQLIRSIDRLDLQARRRRVKGERGMNLSLLSDAIEYRRKNATLLHRHHPNPRSLRPPHQPLRTMYARSAYACHINQSPPPHPVPCIPLTPTSLTALRLGPPTSTHEPIPIKVANPPYGRKATLLRAIGANHRISF